MNAGREIDVLVAEKLMELTIPTEFGVRYPDGNESWGNSEEFTRDKAKLNKGELLTRKCIDDPPLELWTRGWRGVPPYSSDIAAAWQVVEKLQAHYSVRLFKSVTV